ncbi:MAG: T9SS type A sorting domain-containing protein [Calditrichaeota bacterium]|nr:T9SS type A sorting domain-containing protein [Calditrichota bacterium]
MTIRIRFVLIIIICLDLFSAGLSAQPRIAIDPERFAYNLPHGSAENAALNIANLGDTTLVVDVTQGLPRRDLTVNILIWTRYADRDWRLPNLLASLDALDIPHRIREFNNINVENLGEALATTHIFLVPEPTGITFGELFNIGRDWRDLLQAWIMTYRGYIVALDFAGGAARFLEGAGLMSIRLNDVYPRVECEAVGLHPVNAGVLRYTALRSANLHFCNDEGATVVTRGISEPGANITAKRFGAGGIVYIGMNWWQFNQEMTSLLNNSVMWFQGGWSWLLLDQFAGRIEPEHSEDLFFTVDSRLTPEPGHYEREIILLTNDPQAREVRVPVELEVALWQPAKIVARPSEIFIITPAETSAVLLLRNEGGGSLHAQVELADTSQSWLTINRSEIVLEPHFEDRILIRFNPANADRWLNANLLNLHYLNPDPTVFSVPILYYTGNEFGEVEGLIIDHTTSAPVAAAQVNLHGLQTTADERGIYRYPQIPASFYQIDVRHPDYLPFRSPRFDVQSQNLTTVNARLVWCDLFHNFANPLEIAVLPNRITWIVGEFRNGGSGVLNYRAKFHDYQAARQLRPWQTILSVGAGSAVNSDYLRGIAFDGENILLSGLNPINQTTWIWKLDRQGELVDSFAQPADYPLGMGDLAWDGNLVWGSDVRRLIGLDRRGEISAQIAIPLDYAQAAAYAGDIGQFWIANAREDIFRIDRAGRVQQRIRNDHLHIYGLAYQEWAEDGFSVVLFCQDGPSNAQINELNPATEIIRYVCDLPTDNSEYAGGCEISVDWNPRQWTILTQFTGANGRSAVYYLAERLIWARLQPAVGEVLPDLAAQVTLEFDSRGFRDNTRLEGYITIDGGQRGGIDTLFIRAWVSSSNIGDDDGSLQPDEPSLSVYPNPFNNYIALNCRVPLHKPYYIGIYDVNGRRVANPIDGKGRGINQTYRVNVDVLPSGLYFIALHSVQRTLWRRAVLMK